MKTTFTFLFIIIFITASSQVEIRDTTVQWKHHRYELNNDFSIKSYSIKDADIDIESFTNSKVIENEFFKITLIPEFGGRIISYVYKPNGKEYLYSEKISTPYQIGWDTFYYRWLLLWGGIFPTFPEPEHGKTWCRPWDFSIIKQNKDTITVCMQYTDDDEYSNHPSRYNNGQTNITCQVNISVFSGTNMFDYDVKLINNKNANVNFEYWTNTAFAPGCDKSNIKLSPNTEMVVPITNVDVDWNLVPAWQHIRRMPFSEANYYNEWPEQGILYATETPDNYWGIINHDNKQGMFRLCNNAENTPGVKLWTWGVDAIDRDPYDYSEGGASSIIEIWAGAGKKFWQNVVFPANMSKSWKEQYFPTINISKIDDINEFGSLDVQVNKEKKQSSLIINLMPTKPGKKFSVDINLKNASSNYDLSIPDEQIASPLGNQINVDLIYEQYLIGDYEAEVTIYDERSFAQLHTKLPVNIPEDVGIEDNILRDLTKIYSIENKIIKINSDYSGEKTIKVYNYMGVIIYQSSGFSKTDNIRVKNKGIYIVEVSNADASMVQKVLVK